MFHVEKLPTACLKLYVLFLNKILKLFDLLICGTHTLIYCLHIGDWYGLCLPKTSFLCLQLEIFATSRSNTVIKEKRILMISSAVEFQTWNQLETYHRSLLGGLKTLSMTLVFWHLFKRLWLSCKYIRQHINISNIAFFLAILNTVFWSIVLAGRKSFRN